jgi:AraC family transcriptional regulator of adaptative response/methylated-DNA-[protein]-cysteine methyltransferase
MSSMRLPPHDEMLAAFQGRDASYDGVFFTAVRTTGIFCRPTCPARKPRPEHVEFFASARDAVFSGYRPCRRCRPLEEPESPPSWLRDLMDRIEEDPTRRWTDRDLREMGLHPDRVRRWFQKRHGMTFHAYGRARRLGLALAQIREGKTVTEAAFDHGYDSLSGFGEAFQKVLGAPARRAATGPLLLLHRVSTPLGPMIAGATEEALYFLDFADRRMLERQLRGLQSRLRAAMAPGCNPVLEQTEEEIAEYFAGTRRRFTVPMRTPASDFLNAVWERLRRIPYGETVSYAELARDIGRPSAVRAVANANGFNRMSILIPCHRVIGSDGSLTGYGGGLWRKQRLLELEGARPAQVSAPLDPC